MTFKARLLNILFWSVVSAAFIGPGTVTTATKAGATFDFDLLWALLFSTFACLLLQESSARITIATGMNLGQAIAKQFEGRSSRTFVLILVIGAIIVGCAAYETGNILGAVEGLVLISGISSENVVVAKKIFVLIMGLFAVIALNLPTLQSIAKFMGILVMLMGFAFFTTAIYLKPPMLEVARGLTIPSIPERSGAGLLVLGLIGTTVVPYDIFLGSGVLDKKQSIKEMRFGLSIAIILGGIISMAILTVGTIIKQEFSFEALAQVLNKRIGYWAVYIFGFGMFAAGFSSAITAPLASAITAKSLFENERNSKKWKTQSLYFKIVWGLVLLVGLGFGLANVKPIPAIIIAQALNGLVLPFVSIFLILVVNDAGLMGKRALNSWLSNILMGVVVWVTLILGLLNVIKAISSILSLSIPQGTVTYVVAAVVTLGITAWIMIRIYLHRKSFKEKELASNEADNNFQP